jgi:hypothetical protein
MKKICFIIILLPSILLTQWIHQVSPTDIDMVISVDFINTNSGVAGGWKWGFNGRAIYTTNSGLNWILAQVPDSSRSMVKVQMIDANTGYIAGAYNILSPDKTSLVQPRENEQSKQLQFCPKNYYSHIGLTGELESYKGLFLKTTNSGQSWNNYGNLPSNVFYLLGMQFINAATGFVLASFHYGGAESEGILKTTNTGNTWNTLITIDSVDLNDIFTLDGINIYVTGWARGIGFETYYGIILRSTNGGVNWSRQNISYASYFDGVFFPNQTTGFAIGGTEQEMVFSDSIPRGLVYKTTNSGQNWFKLSPFIDSSFYYAVGMINSTGIAVGFKWSMDDWHMLISKTTNYGNNWTHYISSDTNMLIGLDMPDQDIWFVCGGTDDKLIYKTTTGGSIGIKPISNELPSEFRLYQNYPNPFNPTTKIKFSIPPVGNGRDRSVKVIIFDVLGREFATLVNEQLQPGTYETEWDAANYSSGVYYYKLIVGNYTETKKMVLIK